MKELNITYYSGQIKPEFRGLLALFMNAQNGQPVFQDGVYNSPLMREITERHSPMRAYIGVNDKAQKALEERWAKGVCNAFTLDGVLVNEDILKLRQEEVSDFEYKCIEAAAASGK